MSLPDSLRLASAENAPAKAIEELRPEHTLPTLLEVTGMARSTFYYHLKQLKFPDKYKQETPLQPSETTDPPTTGRYLPGQSHQLAASGRRRPQNRSLLPRDFLRYLRVLQGKRTEKQELHEQQSLHACHGSHYPIRQPNSRSHRICGSSLCITAYQDTRRFIRRAALCRSHAGECHQ